MGNSVYSISKTGPVDVYAMFIECMATCMLHKMGILYAQGLTTFTTPNYGL